MRRPRGGYLFHNGDWFSVEEHQKRKLQSEIDRIEGNQLLNTSVDDLCDFFEEKFKIDVPELQKDEAVASQREVEIDISRDPRYFFMDESGPYHVKGTSIEITTPFSGDSGVFRIRPNPYSASSPWAEILDNKLIIEIRGVNLEPQQVKKEIDRTIEEIEKNLEHLRNNTRSFNEQIRQLAGERINRRREKLLADQKLVAELEIPLKERSDAPQTYTAPNVRRRIAPRMPSASTAPYKPEPTLHTDHYEHILSVMTNMVSVMELSPSAFSTMDEETLRSHFLVHLNGHYKGQATGETFNYEGKTDILIRAEGKNIFIAECKYWRGEKKFTATIDQLLGYLSWRDTKAAIVIFNQNKDFSRVLKAIPNVVRAHPNFKRAVNDNEEGRSRYILAHRDDRNREIILTVLAFDVPRRTE